MPSIQHYVPLRHRRNVSTAMASQSEAGRRRCQGRGGILGMANQCTACGVYAFWRCALILLARRSPSFGPAAWRCAFIAPAGASLFWCLRGPSPPPRGQTRGPLDPGACNGARTLRAAAGRLAPIALARAMDSWPPSDEPSPNRTPGCGSRRGSAGVGAVWASALAGRWAVGNVERRGRKWMIPPGTGCSGRVLRVSLKGVNLAILHLRQGASNALSWESLSLAGR